MTKITTLAKKQWQKPDFYLLDSTNINGVGDKSRATYQEKTIQVTHSNAGKAYGSVQKGPSAGNGGFLVSNYVS